MKNFKKLFVFFLTIGVFLSVVFLVSKNKKMDEDNDLINISNLSNSFMENYFEEVQSVSEEEKENMLIITSIDGIDDNFGATKVIEAPNNQYFLQYDSEEAKEFALDSFNNDKKILNVQENIVYYLEETETSYNSWGVEKMSLDSVIDSVDSSLLEDVTVAVIDSGCNLTLFNKYYDGKIVEVYDVLNNSFSSISDENGHGTHVAGTIAESTPSNVKILPIKVSGSNGAMYETDLIAAVDYVVFYEKADVINMSLGGYSKSGLAGLEVSLQAANEKNIVSVAAAGNKNTSSAHYPSGFDGVMSIASVDSDFNKSSFSNYGSDIDFAAPGTDVKSIMSNNTTVSKNNGNNEGNDHETISGTSMATPHISSVVAIFKSFNKNLTYDDTMELLKSKAFDLGETGWDKYYGYGFITLEGVEFCDGNNCDDYNVFKGDDSVSKPEVTKIEVANSPDSVKYYIHNFGNITTLINLSINIYYDNGLTITKSLADLDEAVIEGYDPDVIYNSDTQEGIQIVTIKYANCSTTVKVANSYLLDSSVWAYEIIDENSVKITGVSTSADYVSNLIPSKVYLPEKIAGYNVVEIGDQALKGRTRIRELILPSTLEKIGTEAFLNCENLYMLVLPENLKTINDGAFKNTNLESIIFPESLLKIGANAFANTPIADINIPKNVSEIGVGAFLGCNNVESIKVNSENTIYDSRDGSNAIIETSTNKIIKGNYNTVIPNSIKIIGEKAYYNDDRIEKITVPEGVVEIGYYAFGYNSEIESILKEIVVPRSVTNINTMVGRKDENIKIYTYSDAYAKDYAIESLLSYECMDYDEIIASTFEYSFNAFDKITGRIKVDGWYEYGYYSSYDSKYYSNIINHLIYDGDVSELSTANFELKYIDDRDSLRYGDTYVIIKGKDIYNNDFESNAMVVVSKLIPNYVVPTNLKAELGQTLSEVILPDGFEWMTSNVILEEEGTLVFKAKYTPEDIQNYEVVENIEVNVLVINSKEVVVPNIVISDKIYDGTTEVDVNNIEISNLENINYNIESVISNGIDVGEYTATVKLKLTDESFENYSFDKGKQEAEFSVNYKIVPYKLEKPSLKVVDYVYNGSEQIAIIDNFEEDKMNITGNKRTDVGEQDIIISLKNNNYIWNDNSTDDIVLKFKIEKADSNIKYTSSDASIIYDGNSHGINLNITSPSNVKVLYADVDGKYTLEEMPKYKDIGKYVIKYMLYINDNYEVIYDENMLTIFDPLSYNLSTDYEGVYDGKEHTFNLNIKLDEYTIKYSVGNTNYDLDEIPKFTEVGEYTVNYKIIYNSNIEILGTNKVKIYGIKSIDKNIIKKDNLLLITDQKNDIFEINKRIELYSNNYTITYYDKNNNVVDSGTIGTGSKVVININGINIEYNISILGDVTGEGIINIADIIKIADDILGLNTLVNESEKLAAEVTGDNIINIADVVKIADYTLDNSMKLWN